MPTLARPRAARVPGRRGARVLAPLLLFPFLVVSCDVTEPATRASTLTVLPGEVILDAVGARRTLTFLARDAAGSALSGVQVSWHSEDPDVAPVSVDGVLTALAPGVTTVTARLGDATAQTTVRVTPVPRQVHLRQGEGQRRRAGTTLPVPIVVEATDRLGTPVPGARVHLEPSHGGGVPAPEVAADQAGVASTSWTLGPEPGTQHLAVTVGERHTFFVLADAEDETGRVPFRIRVRFLSQPPPGVEDAFARAVERWEPLFVEKLAPVRVRVGEGRCGDDAPALDQVVDDVLVLAGVGPVDGPGGVVAQANPCFLRESGLLPVAGQLRLDQDDVEAMLNAGILEDVIAHEIGHVLGLGSLWELFGLLREPSLPDAHGADTHFAGPAAVTAFDQAGGTAYPGAKVPVENELGDEGTRDRHWRQSVLDNELLTGFLSLTRPNPLSRITAASLADLGYVVDLDAAEPFALPHGAAALPGPGPVLPIVHLPSHEPVHVLDPSGRVVRTLRP